MLWSGKKTNHISMYVYFNFRSPYCYLAANRLFELLENTLVEMLWRPLGAWSGRSSLQQAEQKRRVIRQDIARWAARSGLPLMPPPLTTDPTIAALGSLQAQQQGCLEQYVKTVMSREWGQGQDIGQQQVLVNIAQEIGLDREKFIETITSQSARNKLAENWQEAQSKGVFGVPSFVVGEEIFWGNDRMDFLRDYLQTQRARLNNE